MKRSWLVILSALALILLLAACGGDTPADPTAQTDAAATAQTTTPTAAPVETEEPIPTEDFSDLPESYPDPSAPEGTTTLMVYMLGSDLEPKSAAGSQDLQEMAESGVDLSTANVVVFAGGSPKWHNELTDSSVGSVLQLTEDCFECVGTRDPVSMGDPETLAWFLDYCVREVPADHYALILWDHGCGPVIGYGKDMLFQGDGLTLAEMRQAMEASPFGPDNKLDWVGFDACLMASAELACVWSDYTDFLIASQEVEPAFGWAYDFLEKLGKQDPISLSRSVTASYNTACLDYFDAKGYADRDTTLACVDLRYAPLLERTLDSLFTLASEELEVHYDQLAANRVNTRALGRATTGSEYDLVDLQDLARRLEPLYPEQAHLLARVTARMVPVNASNSSELHGMSLYFPFFNKKYYQSSWAEAYRELGVFSGYADFLDSYSKTWLSSDMLESFAASTPPAEAADGVYTLELTDEQAAHFAKARYLVMRRNAGDNYTLLVSGSEVERNGNTLTAHFDGQVLNAANKVTGESFIPPHIECDTVDGLTRYKVPVFLMTADEILGKTKDCTFHLTGNKATGEVGITALLDDESENSLTGGKAEDVDVSGWAAYAFFHITPKILTRTDSGLVRDYWDWKVERIYSYNDISTLDEVEFYYAPLSSGEYTVFFEIFDTQGNAYCSEPLEVTHKQTAPSRVKEEKPPVSVRLGSNDAQTFYDEEGIRLSVVRRPNDYGDDAIFCRLENNTEHPVLITGRQTTVNGSISTGELVWLEAEAGETAESRAMEFGYGADAGLLKQVDRIRFVLEIKDSVTYRTITFNQPVEVELSEPYRCESDYNDVGSLKAFLGMKANEQLIYEDETMRIRIIGAGAIFSDSFNAVYSVENLSDSTLNISFCGLVFDDTYVRLDKGNIVPPGTVAYGGLYINSDNLEDARIEQVNKLQLAFALSDTYSEGEPTWCEIRLDGTPKPRKLEQPKKTEIFRQGDVRVYLIGYEQTDYSYNWYVLAENDGDREISIDRIDCMADLGRGMVEEDYSVLLLRLGPHQKAYSSIFCFTSNLENLKALQFRFVIQNFAGNKILETGSEAVTLKTE